MDVGMAERDGEGMALVRGVGASTVQRIVGDKKLTPAHRRIATFLAAQRPAEAGFLTITEVAERSGVSQPSVSRFASALGYAGFNELREALRSAARDAADQPEAPRGLTSEQELVQSEIESLTRLQDSLADAGELRAVAEQLIASRPLPVVGLRISAPLADLFGQFATKALPDVRVLTEAGSPLIEAVERARRQGASSLLAIGLPRYPRELLDCLTWARSIGMTVALITDDPFSPLAAEADRVLVAGLSSRFTFDSYAAPTVLCMLLLQQILDLLPAEELTGLDRFDELASERQFFVR